MGIVIATNGTNYRYLEQDTLFEVSSLTISIQEYRRGICLAITMIVIVALTMTEHSVEKFFPILCLYERTLYSVHEALTRFACTL